MSDSVLPNSIEIPFLHVTVEVRRDNRCSPEDAATALSQVTTWGKRIKRELEVANFVYYEERRQEVETDYPDLLADFPRILTPEGIWDHLAVKSLRPIASHAIVVYIDPEWDDEEHGEWCINGGKLVYCNTFIHGGVDAYQDGLSERQRHVIGEIQDA